MATERSPEFAALLAKHQRTVNCLADPDRTTRKRALVKLRRAFVEDAEVSRPVRQEAFAVLRAPLLKLFSDPVEKCRELSVAMVYSFLTDTVEDGRDLFRAVVPVLTSRLAKSPFPEPAEEMRLALVSLLDEFLKRQECCGEVPTLLPELCDIAAHAAADSFPDVKKATSVLIQRLCKLARRHMHAHVEPLLGASLQNLNHQHSRVRLAALRAVGSLMRCVTGADALKIFAERVAPAVRVVTHDRTGSVRKARCEVIARWIDAAPRTLGASDARRLEAMLAPQLMAGLCDEAPEVQRVALDALSRVADAAPARWAAVSGGQDALQPGGDLSVAARHAEADAAADRAVQAATAGRGMEEEGENEGVFSGKDASAAAGAGGVRLEVEEEEEEGEGEDVSDVEEDADFPTPFTERPSPVLRRYVRAFLSECTNPALTDMGDWTERTRLHGALMLHRVIVTAERAITAHADAVLRALCGAMADDSCEVAAAVAECARALGRYLRPDAYLPSLLQVATGEGLSADAPAHRAQALSVLGHAVRGMRSGERIGPHLQSLADALCIPALSEAENPSLQEQVVATGDSLVRAALQLHAPHAPPEPLVRALVRSHLQLEAGAPALASAVRCSLHRLAVGVGCRTLTPQPPAGHEPRADPVGRGAICDLLARDLPWLVAEASAEHAQWSKPHPRRLLFDSLVREAMTALSPHMAQVCDVFVSTMQPSRDADLRVAMLALLEAVVGTAELAPALRREGARLATEVVLPNATWRVGRVASTIRKVTLACLYALAREALVGTEELGPTFDALQPVLVSCLEDDEEATRRLACLSLRHFFEQLRGRLGEVAVSKLYGELLKRLDDSSDAVRLAVCGALGPFFAVGPRAAYRGTVLDYTLDCLLIHLDDVEPVVQDAVQGAARAAVPIDPAAVAKKCRAARGQQRSPVRCDELASEAEDARDRENLVSGSA